MRNPTLHLLGITTSPSVGDSSISGRSVFHTSRAEEELRHWLETRLDALGIDPVAYSRFVLSLLRRPDSARTPPDNIIGKTTTRRARARYQLSAQQEEREQKRTVIECLTGAAEHAWGVESLVDELCQRLENLTKIDEEVKEPIVKIQANLETLSPQDKAQRYFKAFPALQPTTLKKQNISKSFDSATTTETITIKTKDTKIVGTDSQDTKQANRVSNNFNKNSQNKSRLKNKSKKNKAKKSNKINNNYSYKNNNNTEKHNSTNNKVNKNSPNQDSQLNITSTFNIITDKKSKSSSMDQKESFAYIKLTEMQREKEQELYRQRLAQLEAKFNHSLEALWNNGSNNSSDRDSIWAAPNLSIPESSAWPTDTSLSSQNLSGSNDDDSPDIGDDLIQSISPLHPWEIDWTSPEIPYETALEKNINYNIPWSNSVGDNPWCWQGIGHKLSELKQSPQNNSGFFKMAPCKNVLVSHSTKESRQKKVTSFPEPEEDLLTSARTHFRPIKEDGNWADGTTFPVNNNVESVAYRRSESGNLLYLPGGDSPYMEFCPETSPPPIISTNLTPKFRVRQCDKYVQTEPTWSPIKRRIISERDCRFHSKAAEVSDEDDNRQLLGEGKLYLAEKDNFIIEPTRYENQSGILQHNERKRRHSSSFKHSTLRELRPLTL